MFDPTVLANLSQADILALMESLAASQPDAMKGVFKNSSEVQRLAKQAVPSGGRARTPRSTFFSKLWNVVFASDAMVDALGLEIEEGKDVLTSVLAKLDSSVEGQSDGYTFSYFDGGRDHKVRFTIVSEDRAAEGKLASALDKVLKSNSENFAAIANKAINAVKLGRVDAVTKAEQMTEINSAIEARKTELESDVPTAPPLPPAE